MSPIYWNIDLPSLLFLVSSRRILFLGSQAKKREPFSFLRSRFHTSKLPVLSFPHDNGRQNSANFGLMGSPYGLHVLRVGCRCVRRCSRNYPLPGSNESKYPHFLSKKVTLWLANRYYSIVPGYHHNFHDCGFIPSRIMAWMLHCCLSVERQDRTPNLDYYGKCYSDSRNNHLCD